MVEAEQIINKAKDQKKTERELLRPVAEFFHKHEGKMFERYEAVDNLVSNPNIDSTDERMLARVMANLCDDRVDPVQNVVRDSEKWIGVIEYSENDYWYEYIEHDDVEGRVNVGICAACVKESSSDVEVAKGVGTTEELSERIKTHYKQKHDGEIENVETGATLVSGTTIAGNTAAHTGNDGLGSGLDADTFRGDEAITKNTTFNESLLPAGKVISKIPSPDNIPLGVGVDSNDSIWNFADSDDKIYELDQSGTKISSFSTPSDNGMGVGFDSNDSLWHAARDLVSLIKFDKSGTQLQSLPAPNNELQGLDVDSKDCIWVVDSGVDEIYVVDQQGTTVTEVATPDANPRGLGVNSEDSIWVTDRQKSSLFRQTQNLGDTFEADTISKINSPSNSPVGVGTDSNNRLWVADNRSIFQIYQRDNVKYE